MTAEIIHGDCLEVMRGMAAGSVDAIVTDPPYKLSQEYSASADPDNLIAVSCIWIAAGEMLRVAKPGAVCALFYDTRILPLALRTMGDAGWKYMRALTLYRRWGQASLVHGWMSTSDFVLIFVKPGAKPKFYGPWAHDVYVKAHAEPVSSGHPAQKPLEFVRHICRNITPPDGAILDPFAGSGTTGAAASMEGFGFIGIEREAAYVDISRRRIADVQPTLEPAA